MTRARFVGHRVTNESGSGERKRHEDRSEGLKDAAALGWLVITVTGAMAMGFSEDSTLQGIGCGILLANVLAPGVLMGKDIWIVLFQGIKAITDWLLEG